MCGHAPFNTPNCSTKEVVNHIQHGNVTFEGQEWEKVSLQAKDLISSLLIVNVSQRISLETVMKHSWLLPDTAPATPLYTSNGLQKMGVAENAINYTLHAYHQAARVGVVLGDPSRAPLVRKRKQKANYRKPGETPGETVRPNTLEVVNDET